MEIYTIKFNNKKYVVDIKHLLEVELVQWNFFDSRVLETIHIEKAEITQELIFNSDKFYILNDDGEIEEYDNAALVIIFNDMKKYFINFFYNSFFKSKLNLSLITKCADHTQKMIYFYRNYPNYESDKESVYLDILNEGNEAKILMLEEILNFSTQYNFMLEELECVLVEEEKMVKSKSLPDFIKNMIYYYKSFKTDTTTYVVAKQFSNTVN